MSGDSDGADAVHREVMARINDELGSPPSDPAPDGPLSQLPTAVREWWIHAGRTIAPTLVLRCAKCKTVKVAEIVCDATDPALAVIVRRRVYGESEPVDLRGWNPGENAEQLDAGGQEVLDSSGRSLADRLRERHAEIDSATLRILPDGRRILKRHHEPADIECLENVFGAVCPKHGWIGFDPQQLRAALAATRHGTQRKLLLQPGIS